MHHAKHRLIQRIKTKWYNNSTWVVCAAKSTNIKKKKKKGMYNLFDDMDKMGLYKGGLRVGLPLTIPRRF
jgi:hypothetical protein